MRHAAFRPLPKAQTRACLHLALTPTTTTAFFAAEHIAEKGAWAALARLFSEVPVAARGLWSASVGADGGPIRLAPMREHRLSVRYVLRGGHPPSDPVFATRANAKYGAEESVQRS
jgi:hypothetical protein